VRVVEETPDRLVLQGRPVLNHWLSGSFLVLGVCFVLVFPLLGRFFPGQPIWGDPKFLTLGVLAILASVPIYLCSIWVTLTLDRPANSLRLERAGWFNRSERAEPLSSVSDAVVESSTDTEGSTTYRAVLQLADGRTLPLTLSYDNLLSAKQATVDVIRRFLGRPPSGP
jgi:hypothetical protein